MSNRKKILPAIFLATILAVILYRVFYFKNEFHYVGTIEATQVDIPSRLATIISTIAVHEGQSVEKGQPLLRLSCEDQALASDLANDNFKRAGRLFKIGSLPQEAFDQIKYKKRDSDLRLEWCQVNAPLSGVVLTSYHEPGEWVAPGMRLFTLADLKEVWTYIYVSQQVLAELKLNMKVTAFFPTMKEDSPQMIEGTVIKINDQAEFTPKNVQTLEERTRLVFGVKVLFMNINQQLRPGMSIEIKLPPNV